MNQPAREVMKFRTAVGSEHHSSQGPRPVRLLPLLPAIKCRAQDLLPSPRPIRDYQGVARATSARNSVLVASSGYSAINRAIRCSAKSRADSSKTR